MNARQSCSWFSDFCATRFWVSKTRIILFFGNLVVEKSERTCPMPTGSAVDHMALVCRSSKRYDGQVALPMLKGDVQSECIAPLAGNQCLRASALESPRPTLARLDSRHAIARLTAEIHFVRRTTTKRRVRPMLVEPSDIPSHRSVEPLFRPGIVTRRTNSDLNVGKNRSTTAMLPCFPAAPKCGGLMALRFIHVWKASKSKMLSLSQTMHLG